MLVCIYAIWMTAEVTKMVSSSLELELQTMWAPWCEYRKLDPGPVQEQQVSLTMEPPLQTHVFLSNVFELLPPNSSCQQASQSNIMDSLRTHLVCLLHSTAFGTSFLTASFFFLLRVPYNHIISFFPSLLPNPPCSLLKIWPSSLVVTWYICVMYILNIYNTYICIYAYIF